MDEHYKVAELHHVIEQDRDCGWTGVLRGKFDTEEEALAAVKSILDDRDVVVLLVHWPDGVRYISRSTYGT
jgi:hypothetical protein